MPQSPTQKISLAIPALSGVHQLLIAAGEQAEAHGDPVVAAQLAAATGRLEHVLLDLFASPILPVALVRGPETFRDRSASAPANPALLICRFSPRHPAKPKSRRRTKTTA